MTGSSPRFLGKRTLLSSSITQLHKYGPFLQGTGQRRGQEESVSAGKGMMSSL